MSRLPPPGGKPTKAMRVPSGDHDGFEAWMEASVMRVTGPPTELIT